ncbi:unnamed protein product [Callosobruchus maculatus]|uniref:Uncharacterized protein n=1 Tax=Callosobruchus maculatus TaxID=64391 RepID=A0A653DTF0_CALMS|nr:unnamed protein product [Callosobruchus maculatus]
MKSVWHSMMLIHKPQHTFWLYQRSAFLS